MRKNNYALFITIIALLVLSSLSGCSKSGSSADKSNPPRLVYSMLAISSETLCRAKSPKESRVRI